MSKIARIVGQLVAFASQATGKNRTVFDSTTQSDLLSDQINASYKKGWEIVTASEFPTLEDFNAVFFTHGQILSYIHQMGIPEWDGDATNGQDYYIGSMVNRNGMIYVCKTDAHVSTTPPEDDPANWFDPFLDAKSETINEIVDGNMDYWHEGTSQTTNGYGSSTMSRMDSLGSTFVHSQGAFALGGTFPDGVLQPKYYSSTAATSVAGAGNFVNKLFLLEDLRKFSGKQVTFSFYAKADTAKNIAVEFLQSFGTGGTPSADVTGIGVTTVPLTTDWVRYTVTVKIPNISGKTLGTNGDDSLSIVVWFDAGSNFDARTNSLGQQSGTFDLACVRLDYGDKALDIEYEGDEWRVLRYFELGYKSIRNDYASTSNTPAFGDSCNFKRPKRNNPALSKVWESYNGTSNGNVYPPDYAPNYSLKVQAVGLISNGGTSTEEYQVFWKADSRL